MQFTDDVFSLTETQYRNHPRLHDKRACVGEQTNLMVNSTSTSRRTKPFFNRRIKPLVALALSSSLLCLPANNAMANNATGNDRWFEIEVILLEQLGDVSQANEDIEQLRVQDPTLQGKANIDLISEELNKVLKFKNPPSGCDAFIDFSEFQPKVAGANSNDNQQPSVDNSVDKNATDADTDSGALYVDLSDSEQQANAAFTTVDVAYNKVAGELTDQNAEQDGTELDITRNKRNSQTSTDQGDAQASGYDTDNWFNNQLASSESSAENEYNCDNLLRRSNRIEQELYDIPSVIGGNETGNQSPYLMSKDSLKLTHIRQTLARSKNFRPLLHIGWRQIGEPLNAATPVRLIAGDNVQLGQADAAQSSSQPLSPLQAESMVYQHIKQTINSTRSLPNMEPENSQDSAAINAVNALKQQQLTPLLGDIEPVDIELGINALDINQLQAAQQAFKIDGLMRVHLNHYLFIHAFFNVLDKNDQGETISIPFAQSRRVISGEIHYFDHPYMGMIVQIRRYNNTPDNKE
ncbi:CsiV family protein [Thalassotalea ponticola]|uniref:CsiV family protein n=1 Tax=Thalassotalea ponticola TaxID=1523392 RepID=UPI0025B30741|nr:CsiV family protein [Thalassotalea ponticola]MDN3652615.1 CsiV family protein [Thalassotalea ponticola]